MRPWFAYRQEKFATGTLGYLHSTQYVNRHPHISFKVKFDRFFIKRLPSIGHYGLNCLWLGFWSSLIWQIDPNWALLLILYLWFLVCTLLVIVDFSKNGSQMNALKALSSHIKTSLDGIFWRISSWEPHSQIVNFSKLQKEGGSISSVLKQLQHMLAGTLKASFQVKQHFCCFSQNIGAHFARFNIRRHFVPSKVNCSLV